MTREDFIFPRKAAETLLAIDDPMTKCRIYESVLDYVFENKIPALMWEEFEIFISVMAEILKSNGGESE